MSKEKEAAAAETDEPQNPVDTKFVTFEDFENVVDSTNRHFEALETKVNEINQELGHRISILETRLDSFDVDFEQLKSELEDVRKEKTALFNKLAKLEKRHHSEPENYRVK